VARKLGWRFVDTDQMIVKSAGRQIPDIFENEGEAAFRVLERKALVEAAAMRDCVVSTGGGVPVDPDNRRIMSEAGVVVRLVATPETIHRRLAKGNPDAGGRKRKAAVRPLLKSEAPLERIRELLREREEAYATADATVDTEQSIPEETAARVIAEWESLARARG
jgi:shikimate kinase